MGISKAFGKLNHQISGNKNSQRVMRNTIRNDSTLYKPPNLWQAFKIIVIMSTTINLSLLAYQKKNNNQHSDFEDLPECLYRTDLVLTQLKKMHFHLSFTKVRRNW